MPTENVDGFHRVDRSGRSYPERPLVVPERSTVRVGALISDVTPVALAVTPFEAPQVVLPPDRMTASLVPPIMPEAVAEVLVTRSPKPGRWERRHRNADIKHEKKRTRRARLSVALTALAVVVLLGTGVLGYETWRTNQNARIAYGAIPPSKGMTKSASAAAASSVDDTEGKDETPVTPAIKSAYVVAPTMPRMITIPSIGVDARVLRGTVTAAGAIEAPVGIWDTDWYDGSALPGQPGNAFIDGHISGPTEPAVFVGLKNLKAGAAIQVQRGDGTDLNYVVQSVNIVKVANIDMQQVLAGPSGATQSLTLMTCGGDYLGNYTYDSRVIVQAVRTQ